MAQELDEQTRRWLQDQGMTPDQMYGKGSTEATAQGYPDPGYTTPPAMAPGANEAPAGWERRYNEFGGQVGFQPTGGGALTAGTQLPTEWGDVVPLINQEYGVQTRPTQGIPEWEQEDYPSLEAYVNQADPYWASLIDRWRKAKDAARWEEESGTQQRNLTSSLYDYEHSPGWRQTQAEFDEVMGLMGGAGEEWLRQSQPDYKLVSDLMIAPAVSAVSAGAARYAQETRNQMAGRGLSRSGASASMQGHAAGMANIGRGDILSRQAIANATAQREALDQYEANLAQQAGFQRSFGGLETARENVGLAAQQDIANWTMDNFLENPQEAFQAPAMLMALQDAEDEENALAEAEAAARQSVEDATETDLLWDVVLPGGLTLWEFLGRGAGS